MAFATVDKLQARLRTEWTAFYGAGDDAAALAQADIDEASSLVEGYVGRRYALPMAVVPAILETLTLDIAVARASIRGADEMPEKHKALYDNAIRQLRDISSGAMALPGAAEKGATPGSGSGSGVVGISGNKPQFTRKQLGGY